MNRKTDIVAMICCDLLILWQCYLAFSGYAKVPVFMHILNEFDSALPNPTVWFFNLGPWFFAVPVVSIVVTGITYTLRPSSVWVWISVVTLIFGITFAMQILTLEGISAPFQPMCEKIC